VTPVDQGAFRLPDTPPSSNPSVEKRVAPCDEESIAKRTKQESPSPTSGSNVEKERKVKEKRPAPKPPSADKVMGSKNASEVPTSNDVPKSASATELHESSPSVPKEATKLPSTNKVKSSVRDVPLNLERPKSVASVPTDNQNIHKKPLQKSKSHPVSEDQDDQKTLAPKPSLNSKPEVTSSSLSNHTDQNEESVNETERVSKPAAYVEKSNGFGSGPISHEDSDAVDNLLPLPETCRPVDNLSKNNEIPPPDFNDMPAIQISTVVNDKMSSNHKDFVLPDEDGANIRKPKDKKSKHKNAASRSVNDSVTVVPVTPEPISVVSVNSEDVNLSTSESSAATVVTVNSGRNSSTFDVSLTASMSDQVRFFIYCFARK